MKPDALEVFDGFGNGIAGLLLRADAGQDWCEKALECFEILSSHASAIGSKVYGLTKLLRKVDELRRATSTAVAGAVDAPRVAWAKKTPQTEQVRAVASLRTAVLALLHHTMVLV